KVKPKGYGEPLRGVVKQTSSLNPILRHRGWWHPLREGARASGAVRIEAAKFSLPLKPAMNAAPNVTAYLITDLQFMGSQFPTNKPNPKHKPRPCLKKGVQMSAEQGKATRQATKINRWNLTISFLQI